MNMRFARLFLLICFLGNGLVTSPLQPMDRAEQQESKKRKRTTRNSTMLRPLDLVQEDDVMQDAIVIPITQWKSINQVIYEKNKTSNILGGKLLCGLFSTYNGFKMFEAAQAGKKPIFSKAATEIKKFNRWLKRQEIALAIEQNKKDNHAKGCGSVMSNFGENVIEDLVLALAGGNNNISILGSECFATRTTAPHLITDHVYENIHRFRTKHCPQLILFVCDNHWIAIILTMAEIWVMDSWQNQSQKDSPHVQQISDFFRSEKIIPKAERSAIGNVNRNRCAARHGKAERISLNSSDESSLESSEDVQEPPLKKHKPELAPETKKEQKQEPTFFEQCTIQ